MRIWALLAIMLLLSGCHDFNRFTKTETLMGTEVTITLILEEKQQADELFNMTFSRIKDIEQKMDPDGTGELNKLNTKGEISNASSDLLFVLGRSKYFSMISDGAFDPTVQPLLDLYTKSFQEKGTPPTDEEIQNTLPLVDHNKISISGEKVEIGKGMEITLGGIAKGYAVDEAIAVLKDHGVAHALVNAGGDMRAIGNKEYGQPWMISLQNPRNRSDYLSLLKLSEISVATSGDYERYFDPSFRSHHIMNPKTGRSATELISVTIVTGKAINADALATAVFVLGPVKGMELIEATENAEGLIITPDREIRRSSGFGKFEI